MAQSSRTFFPPEWQRCARRERYLRCSSGIGRCSGHAMSCCIPALVGCRVQPCVESRPNLANIVSLRTTSARIRTHISDLVESGLHSAGLGMYVYGHGLFHPRGHGLLIAHVSAYAHTDLRAHPHAHMCIIGQGHVTQNGMHIPDFRSRHTASQLHTGPRRCRGRPTTTTNGSDSPTTRGSQPTTGQPLTGAQRQRTTATTDSIHTTTMQPTTGPQRGRRRRPTTTTTDGNDPSTTTGDQPTTRQPHTGSQRQRQRTTATTDRNDTYTAQHHSTAFRERWSEDELRRRPRPKPIGWQVRPEFYEQCTQHIQNACDEWKVSDDLNPYSSTTSRSTLRVSTVGALAVQHEVMGQ